MKKKTFLPISALMGALLLALVVGVFPASPFGEREVVHAQTAPELTGLSLEVSDVTGGGLIDDVPETATLTLKRCRTLRGWQMRMSQ